MKVDMSPEGIGERLWITSELSESLLKATFDERCKSLLDEHAELKNLKETIVTERKP
jgi:hypothetical protein